jgi:hypothetical protein
MNALSFRSTDENGLSFELLVDGVPLGKLVGAQDWAFPYWDVVDDLPRWPPHGERCEPELRIVCCCSCGEYGCGPTQCRVVRDGNEVVFRDFDFDASPEGRRQVFRFPLANYTEVVSRLWLRCRRGLRRQIYTPHPTSTAFRHFTSDARNIWHSAESANRFFGFERFLCSE